MSYNDLCLLSCKFVTLFIFFDDWKRSDCLFVFFERAKEMLLISLKIRKKILLYLTYLIYTLLKPALIHIHPPAKNFKSRPIFAFNLFLLSRLTLSNWFFNFFPAFFWKPFLLNFNTLPKLLFCHKILPFHFLSFFLN